jgi:hypothetical protein
MNPSFPQEDIDAAYADDPSAAGAEYGAEFRSDVQQLFDPKTVEDVPRRAGTTAQGRHHLPRVR